MLVVSNRKNIRSRWNKVPGNWDNILSLQPFGSQHKSHPSLDWQVDRVSLTSLDNRIIGTSVLIHIRQGGKRMRREIEQVSKKREFTFL